MRRNMKPFESLFRPRGKITPQEKGAVKWAANHLRMQVEDHIMRNAVTDCGLEKPSWRVR